MPTYFFATDLHGRIPRYEKLLAKIELERPQAVLLGGDLLPRAFDGQSGSFIAGFLVASFSQLQERLGRDYPPVFLIPGNDDPRVETEELRKGEGIGLWQFIQGKKVSTAEGCVVFGYGMIPPTPFLLKDWERYDVSRYVPPGSVSPEEGIRTVPCEPGEVKWGTIANDLEELTCNEDLSRAIMLLHTPPYDTPLDRAALDGRFHEGVPLDLHIGSIAVERFIRARQPMLTLHGHVHESTRLSGEWKIKLGRTVAINAAHDRSELALVRFDPGRPDEAGRELL